MHPSERDSRDSRAPSITPSKRDWQVSVGLFAATLFSVLLTGFASDPGPSLRTKAIHSVLFTATLLSILLAHEFGHFFAAKIHRVAASPPYFIPLPLLSPFGTMGAVIRMRDRITTKNSLFDIGAAGPLAGMAVAVPMYIWGIKHSRVIALGSTDGAQLGESLLSGWLDHLALGPLGPGNDLQLSPVAFAAWAGFFVTMINLLPLGQLDGGHVAYALFGKRQNRIAPWVHRTMLLAFVASVGTGIARDVSSGFGFHAAGRHIQNSMFWLMWFVVQGAIGTASQPIEKKPPLPNTTRLLAVLGLAILAGWGRESGSILLWGAWFFGLIVLIAMEAKWGVLGDPTPLEHPPTNDEPLTLGRRALAVVTLLLFVLLFMPTPIAI